MGDEEETTLATQNAAIMKKLDIALGAFISFSAVGLLLGAIATYYMQKVETVVASTTANEREIAVIKAERKTTAIDYDRRFQMIDRKFERVKWQK